MKHPIVERMRTDGPQSKRTSAYEMERNHRSLQYQRNEEERMDGSKPYQFEIILQDAERNPGV